MRRSIIALGVLALVAACSRPAEPPKPAAGAPAAPAAGPAAAPSAAAAPEAPAAAISGPPVSGTYLASGKPAPLAFVTAAPDEPFSGKPVTKIVFSVKDQAGSEKPDFDAIFGKFGDAMVVRVQPDGSIIGADLVHEGLMGADRSVSLGGVLQTRNFVMAGGQISGTITSNGVHDVFGHPLDVNLNFHVKAP